MNRESFPLSLSAANQNEAPGPQPPVPAERSAAPPASAPKEAPPRAPPARWWKNKEKVEYAARLAGLLAVLVGIPGVMLDLPGKWKNFNAGGSIVNPAAPAATPPDENASYLRGRFTDHQSGAPLAGIRLFFPEQNRETRTNPDGLFEIELPVAEDSRVKLLATLDGYHPVDDDPPAGTFLHQMTMRRVP